MREIPLSKGAVALVDDDDYERLLALGPWHLAGKPGYANADLRMHRYLMEVPEGDPRIVHHKNENSLDNRRANLEVMSQRHHLQLHNGIGSRRKLPSGRWQGRAYISGKQIGLGTYDTEKEAIAASIKFYADLDGQSMV